MDIREQLAAAKKRLEEARAEMMRLSQEVFMTETKFIFDAYPFLMGFGWGQGTPSFCDGDPCDFYVFAEDYGLQIELNDETTASVLELGRERSGRYNRFNGEDLSAWRETNPLLIQLNTMCKTISDFLQSTDGQFMENTYGDPIAVFITRDGTTELDDYDVGY
jgi:hypothetical protein